MKGMKYIIVLLSAFFVGKISAQPDIESDEKRKEKIETLKRAYMSEKLELTIMEAEKFWPVYNEYNKKKDLVKKSIRISAKKMKEGNHSEKDAIATIDSMTQNRKEDVDLDSKFLKDCIPVLGVEKVMTLATLQKDFQKELIQKIKERRQGGQAPGNGMRQGQGQGRRRN